MLGFECFLRISEVVRLEGRDIVFRGDGVLPRNFARAALIRLGKTKTGKEQRRWWIWGLVKWAMLDTAGRWRRI